MCNSELRSFEKHLAEFRARDTQIVAISVDSNEESRALCQSQGYTFPILSDSKAEVIRAYGVLHVHGGEDGQDIARPAEFLVDQAGTIRWANLTENLLARLRPDTVLRIIDGLSMTPSDGNRGAKLKKSRKMIPFSAKPVADFIVLSSAEASGTNQGLSPLTPMLGVPGHGIIASSPPAKEVSDVLESGICNELRRSGFRPVVSNHRQSG